MPNPIRFVLALHNHQPVGNLDDVLQRAYDDSYRPFLDVLSRYPWLKISLHTSGSLMEWLANHQPDYLDRLAGLVERGQVEILGGAWFEPILSMIPSWDRIGQIRGYTRWLQNRLGATIRGLWVPERVWEQSCAHDLVDAGIEYTVLDDFHFRAAGLNESQLAGHLLTEDEGRLLSIFPGSEKLRYTIPFADPQQTIDYLAGIAEKQPNAVVVFGDDGEKFGVWPETKKHVYEDGWLTRFFDALAQNQTWIQVTTLAEAFDNVPPVGKVYLPDCSYREMTEWSLPTPRQIEFERLAHEMHNDPHWPVLRSFLRGGFWRNFKVKYPEANEMYSRMMTVSRRVQETIQASAAGESVNSEALEQARLELYRGQCNCSYWHGAFGGIYLPHLRNAVYQHLIAADNWLDRAVGKPDAWIEAIADDYNFDARQEVRLTNDRLMAIVAPNLGGQMIELDVRRTQQNLLATLDRRPEVYHEQVRAGQNQQQGHVASIHERVVFKQPNLDQCLQYDDHARKSLVDLFYDNDATLEAVARGTAPQRGDFVHGAYEARIRRNPDRIQVQLAREGNAWGIPIRITKGLTLDAGSATLQVAYLLENLPQGRPLHFAVEMNFAGLPSNAFGRNFWDINGNLLGQLGTKLDLTGSFGLTLTDEWQGIDVGLKMSRPTNFWTFPIETVSQSEGGFELVHQSVAVLPHWIVEADKEGRWSVTMQLSLDTTRAENRNNHHEEAVAAV
ncbi:MAG: alpha-amylase/4-alpha-glucanotransferase domain-containing protein [Thermoguttaceae bacterium]